MLAHPARAAAIVAFAATAMLGTTGGKADETLKIGVLATLEGPFEPLGRDAIRGMSLALEEFDGEAGDVTIEPLVRSTDGSEDGVVAAARDLINQGAHVLIGPLTGRESLAMREFAKRVSEVTIINGASAAQDATLREPAANFFRFNADAVQWVAGLGAYAFDKKGYRRVVAIAEDYSFPYTQLMGFMVEYCGRGGRVIDKHWVSHGERDFAQLATRVSEAETDALFVALDPETAAAFLTAYWQAGGSAPVIGGSTTLTGAVLKVNGEIRPLLDGALSAMPVAEDSDSRQWQSFVARYRARYPDAGALPSIFAIAYYVNTKAVLLALDDTDGELQSGHVEFREALAELEFETPFGPVSLDENRQAIANAYIIEFDESADGALSSRVVEVVEDVDQTLGMPRDEFLALGPPGRDNPACP